MSIPGSEEAGPSLDSLLSRRDFAIMSVAAGLAGTASVAHAAAPVAERAVAIKTQDGICDAVFVHPQGKARSPAVIVFPDALGLRPVMVEMAGRLAAHGYAVLVVNQFYRLGKAPVHPAGFDFANPDDRARLMKMIDDLDQAAVTRDSTSFISFLDAQPEVDTKARMGSVGFCMGGKMTIWVAALDPDRVGAAASFHGGGLVTDKPNSPHIMIPATKAAYHIGVAADDDAKEPDAKTILKQTLERAGLPATVEVYPGANHGWMVPGGPSYNADRAERGWAAMLALYKQALT